MKQIITIEGNIGVGKTTFIDIIKKNITDCDIVYEPVEMWKDLKDTDGQNILQKFYENIPRWGYSFQNLACITRMMKIEEIIKDTNANYVFLDRSLGTDKNVFEKMLYDSGNITEIEHQMYNLWCDFYYKYVRPELNNKIIYLRCNPEIALNRIKKRGRVEEKDISIDYLTDLHKYHEEWLLNDTLNVIVIDCNKDFENDIDYQNEILKKINVFIN
jgi:deoxycitidine kinase/deoxyguanosine kinase